MNRFDESNEEIVELMTGYQRGSRKNKNAIPKTSQSLLTSSSKKPVLFGPGAKELWDDIMRQLPADDEDGEYVQTTTENRQYNLGLTCVQRYRNCHLLVKILLIFLLMDLTLPYWHPHPEEFEEFYRNNCYDPSMFWLSDDEKRKKQKVRESKNTMKESSVDQENIKTKPIVSDQTISNMENKETRDHYEQPRILEPCSGNVFTTFWCDDKTQWQCQTNHATCNRETNQCNCNHLYHSTPSHTCVPCKIEEVKCTCDSKTEYTCNNKDTPPVKVLGGNCPTERMWCSKGTETEIEIAKHRAEKELCKNPQCKCVLSKDEIQAQNEDPNLVAHEFYTCDHYNDGEYKKCSKPDDSRPSQKSYKYQYCSKELENKWLWTEIENVCLRNYNFFF